VKRTRTASRQVGTQPRRHHLVELRERPQGRLARSGDRAARGEAQGDRRRDGLLVVEEQRRQPGARAELVATADARHRLHGIAECAQSLYVAADAAVGDAQLGGEVGGRPGWSPLEQRQQPQHPLGRCLDGHTPIVARIAERPCPLFTRGWDHDRPDHETGS
jgi:hypothetical protein